jgi:hypothetical protein
LGLKVDNSNRASKALELEHIELLAFSVATGQKYSCIGEHGYQKASFLQTY